ncbi:MAG: S9 family peptidase [Phycisphaerae bacterium]|nr:S9 family peptidase [Phycisphaerae bacterium]
MPVFIAQPATAERPAYPEARVDNLVEELHGVQVPDPYRWLENGDDAEVQAWTAAENALTRQQLDRFETLRSELRERLTKLYSATYTAPPANYGNKYFFTRREAGQDHSIVYVRLDGLNDDPKVVINPNEFSEDGTVALDWWVPSPDGSLIAYGKSESGSELSTLHLRDVRTGTDLALKIPYTRACAIGWDPDSQGFHYTRYPTPGSVAPGDERYNRHVFYHKFGTNWEDDPEIFGKGLPKEVWNDVSNSSDNRYQFISSSRDWTKNDLYMRSMDEQVFHPVAVGLDGEFKGDTHDGKLYLLTNYKAPRYRVLVCDVDNTDENNWRELIPEHDGVIRDMVLAGGKIVMHVMENAYSQLRVYNLDGSRETQIKLPTFGTVDGLSGRSNLSELFFKFESFAYPPTVYHYRMNTKKLTVLEQMDVPAKLDNYAMNQVWFESKDGTRVPMFVVHTKGMKKDGNNPTLLYGYGGFNGISSPFFWRSLFDWLDRGGVFALASIRGGGEFGKEWHVAGRLGNKQNTFDDFIAAAEKLIADKYTCPERLAIRGGSNGGLLVGAVMVQRPELFKAVVCEVPLLDMLRYHQREIARLWIPEYGDPDLPKDFKWLYAYSPYQNIRPDTAYPSVLFRTAESDSRVDPMHARKMAARLQAVSTSDNPVLLWIEPKAGHGAGQPLSKYLDGQLDIWTFLLWQLGVVEAPGA